MHRINVQARTAAARLWGIAAGVAALDAVVALELKPETALYFAAVVGLCAVMAVFSRVATRRDAR